MYEVLFIGLLAFDAALAAARSEVAGADWLGATVVGGVAAVGGGTVRDVVLGIHPILWVAHPEYLWITALAGLAAALACPWIRPYAVVWTCVDALALAFFSAVGAHRAYALGQGWTVCIVAAVLTGACGGMLRDLLFSRMPRVLSGELYISVSIATAALYVAWSDRVGSYAFIVAVIVGTILRLMAIAWGWCLPKVRLARR